MKHPSRCLAFTLIAFSLLACGKKMEHAPAAAASPASTINVSGTVSATGKADSLNASSKILASKEEYSSAHTNDQTAASPTTAQRLASTALSAAPKGRQLVRTGQLNFTVKDAYAANLAIEEAVLAHDGFVVQSTINSAVQAQNQYPAQDGLALRIEQIVTTADVVLRVPSAKAQTFLTSLAKHIQTMEQRTLAANDVQFDALRQQLEQARAQTTGVELEQVIASTNKASDKLHSIAHKKQAQIEANEALLGKLTLADQVDFATLTLHFTQAPFVRKTTVTDFESVHDMHRPGFFQSAAEQLISGWNALKSTVLYALGAWPFLIVLFGLIVCWRKGIFAKLQAPKLKRRSTAQDV